MNKTDLTKKNEDRTWLVKASNSILGPFTLSELIQNIRVKTVNLLDEARTPGMRWLFVRDISEIRPIIAKLTEEETIEKTQSVATINLSNMTVTGSMNDETTPIPLQIPIKQAALQTLKVSPPPIESVKVKSYGLNPPSEPIPWLRWLMMAVASLSFLVALGSFIQRKNWESDQKRTWSEFQQFYVAQLYDDAYKKLKEFQRDFPEQPIALTRAGFLFLNPGRELVNARRMFERSSQLDPSNKELMVQNLNGLGLVALYEGQLVQSKYNLDRALTLEPANVLTRINLISLSMSLSQWDDAFNLAQQIRSTDPKKAALIQSAVTILSTNQSDKIKSLIESLEKSIDSSSYLIPAIRLMLLKLTSLNRDFAGFETQMKLFFKELPNLHVNYSETPMIDQRWRDWNFLYQFCNDIKGPPEMTADILAIQIICVSEIQKWNEADKMISEGLKRFPNNHRIFLAQLDMLAHMSRWQDVKTLINAKSLTPDSTLSWLAAKSCVEEKNNACTEIYLKPLLKNTPISTSVYELQAQYYCAEKIDERCRYTVTQGLTQDPFAYGLLKLKFQIEAGL
jgi:tetratricopeptide (TPR) repeat protein